MKKNIYFTLLLLFLNSFTFGMNKFFDNLFNKNSKTEKTMYNQLEIQDLFKAIDDQNVTETKKIFLRNTTLINSIENSVKETPLMRICSTRNTTIKQQIIEFMLSKKLKNINVQDAISDTALIRVVDSIFSFTTKETPISKTYNLNDTFLDFPESIHDNVKYEMKFPDNNLDIAFNIVKILVENGAKVNIKGFKNRTVIDIINDNKKEFTIIESKIDPILNFLNETKNKEEKKKK